MKKLYLVLISATISREQLIHNLEKDSRFGLWFYSIANSFFIYSSLDADGVCDEIKKTVSQDERMFVVEVGSNCQGWIPGSHWDLIHWRGADKKYDLDFRGYYRKAEFLDSISGIYCVFRGAYVSSNDTVIVKELLYVGQSENVKYRHVNHENKEEWQSHLLPGEELLYSMAPLAKEELVRCEAALIYKNKPVCNHTGKDTFAFSPTLVEVKGRVCYLQGGLIEC